MAKRSGSLGLVVAVLALGSFGCTTLRRAGSPTSVEEVDMLADVELTEEEAAQVAQSSAPAAAPAQRPNSVDVAWTPSGKNIQLAKLPPVKPVTASMLSLGKREDGRIGGSRLDIEAPPRGVAKADPAKLDAGKLDATKR